MRMVGARRCKLLGNRHTRDDRGVIKQCHRDATRVPAMARAAPVVVCLHERGAHRDQHRHREKTANDSPSPRAGADRE